MSQGSDEFKRADRRRMPRYPSRAPVKVFRDSDAMRLGIAGRLTNVSTGGAALRLGTGLNLNEQIKIEIRNEIQKFAKTVRGVVRGVDPLEDEEYLIRVEFLLRLTPLEISMLKSPVDDGESGKGPV